MSRLGAVIEGQSIGPDASLSPEGDRVRETLAAIREDDASVLRGHRRALALESLDSAVREALAEGWDGYGARPAGFRARARAESFLDALPGWVEIPDISVHPDGEIGLEWYRGPRRVLTIGIGDIDSLSYASLLGDDRSHGFVLLFGSIPTIVLFHLRLVHGG